MLGRIDLKKLARAKLAAAKILFAAGDFDNAGYLLGYVVECALKATICRKLALLEYPDTGRHHDVFASHEVDRLLILSGYSQEIDLSRNSDLFQNWSTLTKDWKPDVRYNVNIYSQDTIEEKIKALEDPQNGFFSWIKKKW